MNKTCSQNSCNCSILYITKSQKCSLVLLIPWCRRRTKHPAQTAANVHFILYDTNAEQFISTPIIPWCWWKWNIQPGHQQMFITIAIPWHRPVHYYYYNSRVQMENKTFTQLQPRQQQLFYERERGGGGGGGGGERESMSVCVVLIWVCLCKHSGLLWNGVP